MGVFRDVLHGGLQPHAVLQLDKPLLLEQQQGPPAVGGVVGDGDLRAGGQGVQAGALAGVDAEGLIVQVGHADQVGAVVGVEVVHVGDVLKVVGVQLSVLHIGVGQHIVVVGHDLQRDVILGQDLLYHLQNLGVGRRGGAHLDGGGLLAAAGGQQGQGEDGAQRQGKHVLFHFHISFSLDG